MKRISILLALLMMLSSPVVSKETKEGTVLSGKVTHVRDGDTITVNNVPIRLAALDCPERGAQKGDTAARIAQQFLGSQAVCELTEAKAYD